MKCYRVTPGALIVFNDKTYRPNTVCMIPDDGLAARLVAKHPRRFIAIPATATAPVRVVPPVEALGGDGEGVTEAEDLPERSVSTTPSRGRRSRSNPEP